jgi:hypothetical protein
VALAAAMALAGAARSARAAGDPALDWRTIETAHFRVHYERGLEPVATRVAEVSEAVHERLVRVLGHTPGTATEIVLTDDTDQANGSASALPYSAIRLFVTAPGDMSPLSDYDDWYTDLVTHEYTHILHTDNISGIPAIVNRVLGKTYAPNQAQPRWVLEGLAVLVESEHTSAGRLRGTLFDMHLRADVLDDNVAGLDRMSSGAHRWPQGNLFYLYGSHFVSWITSLYGPNTMRAVSADYGASLVPWGINRAIRRATGRTYVELYEGFVDHLRRRTAAQVDQVTRRGLREGVRLTRHGNELGYARFVPPAARAVRGREELVYYRNDLDHRTGIYRLPLGELREGGERDEELVARTTDATAPAFGPRGDLYFTSVVRHENVYLREDMFTLPPGAKAPSGDEPERRRLTRGARVSAPDVSPDGKRVVYTVNARGTTSLEIASLTRDGALEGPRALVTSRRFDQAYTPRFSPDGRRVAWSAWSAGGYRDIRVVDVATGAVRSITNDRALDLQPAWSPDGRTLYFASDRTGISNVYAYDVERGALAQVTNVRTGAFQPAVSPDGSTLVYTGYTSKGYDLFAMRLDPARFLEALPAPANRPDPPTDLAVVPMRRHAYDPLPTLGPRAYSFEYKPGSYGGNALTLEASGSDVVGHHNVHLALTADTNAPAPSFTADYTYGRLPFNLSVRLFQAVAPRGGYRINDQQPLYDETSTGVTTGVSYPIVGELSSQGIGLSYTAAAFHGDLPVGADLDPYARVTIPPRQKGTVGVLHLGYGYSSVEGSIATAGPARGVSFSVGLDLADEALASDFTLRAFEYSAAAYLPMPWPGHHTLAIRSAGALSTGTYGRTGVYFVGGYDLESHDLVDSIESGVFNGAFVVRGYPARAFVGREYLLENLEYRFPIAIVDRGPATLPVFLRRLDGNLFLDYGGAFNELDLGAIDVFHDGYLIDSPQLHAAVGAELWTNLTLGYYLGTQLRLGYARGFGRFALDGGQWYFVASSAF